MIEVRGFESRKEFSRRIGVNQFTLGNYERGSRLPDAGYLTLLAMSEGISVDWLLLGRGNRYLTVFGPPEPSAVGQNDGAALNDPGYIPYSAGWERGKRNE